MILSVSPLYTLIKCLRNQIISSFFILQIVSIMSLSVKNTLCLSDTIYIFDLSRFLIIKLNDLCFAERITGISL